MSNALHVLKVQLMLNVLTIVKYVKSKSVSCPVVSDSLRPHGLLPASLLHPWDSQARILEWVVFPSPRDLPDAGIEPRSPTLQADSLLSKPPGKYKKFKKQKRVLMGIRSVLCVRVLSK